MSFGSIPPLVKKRVSKKILLCVAEIDLFFIFDKNCQNAPIPLHRKPIKQHDYGRGNDFSWTIFGKGFGDMYDVGRLCRYIFGGELSIE
jgi:hypothetical protein